MTTDTKTRLDTSAALETLRVISQWMDVKRQFTCFEITREVRARKQAVRHQATRDFVHSLHGMDLPPFANSGYERATVSFTTAAGHNDTAEVYRLIGDTSDYDPDQGQAAPTPVASVVAKVTGPNQVTPTVVKQAAKPKPKQGCAICGKTDCAAFTPYTTKTVNKPAAKPATTQSDKFSVDNRGRICVRNSFVQTMGLKAGDRIYLQKTNDGDIVLMRTVPQTNYIGNLKVDRNGNVRVTRHLQGKAGITADKFSMELVNGSVVLKA